MTVGDANTKLESAFLKLIMEKPFAKITVNDIVEEAGVHRNTFYYHYQSIPSQTYSYGLYSPDRQIFN